jgi:MYXO-CTERM domain-containing protein
MALFDWLTDNGYDIPEASVPLLMEYIDDGTYFLALKLQQDRGTGEIQPVVLRYEELKPCVPIKLTAIATVPDMPITAYVLADRRARPSNYMATEPDLDDPGFWLGTESYANAVSRAVDDAGGQAFVTDYAGATPALSLAIPSVDDLRTETDPGQFLMRLRERGFTGDTQLLGILIRHIPPPDGVEPTQFYNCLTNGFCGSEYDAYIASLAFDPEAFVDDLETAIVEPRQNAQDLVDGHAQLTRLFTTMSAEEMTLDPLFDLDADVPEVSNVHRATRVTECTSDYFEFHAPVKLVLPSGAEHVVQEGIAYLGDDEAYCDDRRGGMYGPYVDPERARATAARRGIELGGGGGCSVSGGAGGLGLAFLVVLGVFFARRRR